MLTFVDFFLQFFLNIFYFWLSLIAFVSFNEQFLITSTVFCVFLCYDFVMLHIKSVNLILIAIFDLILNVGTQISIKTILEFNILILHAYIQVVIMGRVVPKNIPLSVPPGADPQVGLSNFKWTCFLENSYIFISHYYNKKVTEFVFSFLVPLPPMETLERIWK